MTKVTQPSGHPIQPPSAHTLHHSPRFLQAVPRQLCPSSLAPRRFYAPEGAAWMHCRPAPGALAPPDGERGEGGSAGPLPRIARLSGSGAVLLPMPLLSTAHPATLSHPCLFLMHNPAHAPSLCLPLAGPAPPLQAISSPNLGSLVQIALTHSQRQLTGSLRPIPAFIGAKSISLAG